MAFGLGSGAVERARSSQAAADTDSEARAANPARGASPSAPPILVIHLALLLVAVSWGSNFVSIKYLLRSMGPIDVLLVRLVLASLFFGLLLLLLPGPLPRFAPADRPKVLLMALLGITLNTGAIAFGTRLIPAAVGSLIVTGNPVFTAIISRVVAGEPLTRRKLTGIGIAFAGFLIVLLYGGPEARFSVQNALGVLITLIGPVVWAFYTVLSKPLLARYDPTRFAGVLTVLGTIPLLPLLLLNPGLVGQVAHFQPTQWLAASAMSVFALVFAYVVWYQGLRVLTPTQVAVYVYLVPVFGALGAWLLLGERITVYLILGGLTILLGVIVTNSARHRPVDPSNREMPDVEVRSGTAPRFGHRHRR